MGDIHVGTQVTLLKRIDSFKLASNKLLITSNDNKIFNKTVILTQRMILNVQRDYFANKANRF